MNDRYCTARLITLTQQTDDEGNILTDDDGIDLPPVTSKRVEIPVEVVSYGQSEFFKSGQEGFRPDMKLITFKGNYNGEEYAEVDGIMYKIYRSFFKNYDNIELYLTKRIDSDE